MATITHPGILDTRRITKAIKQWLDDRKFETKVFQSNDIFTLKARKSSVVRSIFGADRALEIDIRPTENQTAVTVGQGSWTTNAVSNSVWLVATGGMNLVISGWSLVTQKELETHIRGVLAELGGLKEVSLE